MQQKFSLYFVDLHCVYESTMNVTSCHMSRPARDKIFVQRATITTFSNEHNTNDSSYRHKCVTNMDDFWNNNDDEVSLRVCVCVLCGSVDMV
jgi:hypothetical protein